MRFRALGQGCLSLEGWVLRFRGQGFEFSKVGGARVRGTGQRMKGAKVEGSREGFRVWGGGVEDLEVQGGLWG